MRDTPQLPRRLLVGGTFAGAAVGVTAWLVSEPAAPGVLMGSAQPGEPAHHLPTVAPQLDRAALTAQLDAHRAARGGTMGLVVHDLRTGGRFAWREFQNESLSTIKVLILMACLMRVEATGQPFTDAQHSLAGRMIKDSDNEATDALLAWVGTPEVQRTAELLGLSATTVRSGGPAGGDVWWGYSTTTASDLVAVVDAVATGTSLIHAGHRAYIRQLMSEVVPDQRWGVADPSHTSGAYTEIKNGWGPMPDGYRLNSMGRVVGNGRRHTLAILTRSPQGFEHGRETITGLARIVYDALVLPLSPH